MKMPKEIFYMTVGEIKSLVAGLSTDELLSWLVEIDYFVPANQGLVEAKYCVGVILKGRLAERH